MDLVVGATGFVGKRIALRLRQEGRSVRALVRGGASRAEAKELRAAGVELADGDLTRPGTLAAACEGIDTVITTATSMPHGRDDGLRRIDHDGALALIEAAEHAGVKKFIYTSYSGNIRYDSPLETAKRACEERLLASQMRSIILRPSYFMEVWLSPALGFDPGRAAARIYGTGEAKVHYISAFDVAEFAVATAKADERLDVVLEMGGPQPLSQLDAVRLFEQARGKKFDLEFVPESALEQQHRAATDPLQRTFAALTLAYARGDTIPQAQANAARYHLRLRSLRDFVNSFRTS
jgi:NADH dehydrogenase